MKNTLLLITIFTFFFLQKAEACHNSTIDNVVAVDNGNGTTTYTIDFTVDVGSLDNYSLGFAFIFASSSGTPLVLSSPAYTAFVTRAGYNNLVAYTGAAIGTGLGADPSNYFDDRYGNRTDVITYESDDDFWGFGSTDYSRQIVVTVQGCVETITLDGDFRTVGSATPAGAASCLAVYNTGVSCNVCGITALAAGSQTACDAGTNTYTQEVTVTYTNAPGSGTLDVNGQSFAITSSPQTVTLTSLVADGNAVDVTAVFSADGACTLTSNGLFTAPVSCSAICGISNIAAGSQTACDAGTNTYTQEVIISYTNEPGSGTLDVNGQSFAITSSPQTVTLVGLVSDGNGVNVSSSFSADAGCTETTNNLFSAPAPCNVICNPDNGTWD